MPYDYMVEVTNRFKGFDLIECLKKYGQRFLTLCRKQGSKPSPRKINENSCEKKRSKRQRRKGKIDPFEHKVQKNSKER